MPKETEKSAMQSYISSAWRIVKLYEDAFTQCENKHGITRSEKNILLFLYNNPKRNTASDIVEYRSISKGMVSMSVDSLVKSGLLTQNPSKHDRRVNKLQPTEKCKPIMRELRQVQVDFFDDMLVHLDLEEWEHLQGLTEKLFNSMEEGK